MYFLLIIGLGLLCFLKLRKPWPFNERQVDSTPKHDRSRAEETMRPTRDAEEVAGPSRKKTFVRKSAKDPLDSAAKVELTIVKPEEPTGMRALRGELEPFLSTIIKHLPALRVRRGQLVTSDPYGNAVTAAWHDEIDYFILRNLLDEDVRRLEHLKTNSWPYPGAPYLRLKHTIDLLAQNADLVFAKGSREDVEWSGLEPLEFERRCCEALIRAGWQARTTVASGDQGIDIIATHGDQKLVIQCKRYSGRVGNSAVQEIVAGRAFERADLAAVISTGAFTKSARQLAAASDVALLHPSQIPATYSRTAPGRIAEGVTMDADQLIDRILIEVHAAERRALNSFPRDTETSTGSLTGIDPLWESDGGQRDDDDEPGHDEALYQQALDVLKSTRRASTSLLQRRLKIRYDCATRIMEIMEEKGIVGPENGSSPREILADLDTL